jgi:PAS domain S-box-containing protein
MILSKKTLLFVSLVFTSLFGAIYATSSTILLNSLKKAEEQDTRQTVERVLSVFAQTQQDFGSRYADWAAWDDSYKFVQDGNKNFIKSNLTPEVLSTSKLNLLLHVNTSGQIVFGTGFDLKTKKNLSIPEAIKKHLSPNDLLLQHTTVKSIDGIFLLPSSPMLIASLPIVTSQGKGPIRGTLICGRYLDADSIKKVAQTTLSSITMYGINDPKMPADFQAVRSSISKPKAILVRRLSKRTIAGYTLLNDIYGKPAVLLRVDIPREIYQQGQSSLYYLVVSLVVVGLVFGVVTLMLLERANIFQQHQRYAEEKYRSIFVNAAEGIFQTTPEGQYISANPALARIYGYESPEELIGHIRDIKVQLYVEPATREEFIRLMQEYDTVFEFESQIYHQDGRIIWISENVRSVRDSNGELLFYEGTVQDITKRKQAEEELRQTRNFLETMIDHLPVAVVVKDGKEESFGVFRLWNKTSEKIFGLTSEQAIGKTARDYFPPEQADFFEQKDREAFERGSFEDILEEAVDSYSLGRRILHTIKIPLYNEYHEPEYLLCIAEDITDRKQAQEAQLRAQVAEAAKEEVYKALETEKQLGELKSRFVSMTSHEFRTPLTTILSSAELIQDYGHKWTQEKKLQHLQRIQTSVKHMTNLLDDVLLIGKAEAGKLDYNPVLLDLVQFCRDLVEEIQTTTKSHAITFISQNNCTDSGQTSCERVYMDEKLLRHILSNLLSNAIKYSPQDCSVNFDLVCEQEEAVFKVRDRGIGIPEKDRAKLFDSFHRASNVGTISGTGLGLAIVKKAVDLHGGKITVESEVGVGTTFIISLPLNNENLSDEIRVTTSSLS